MSKIVTLVSPEDQPTVDWLRDPNIHMLPFLNGHPVQGQGGSAVYHREGGLAGGDVLGDAAKDIIQLSRIKPSRG